MPGKLSEQCYRIITRSSCFCPFWQVAFRSMDNPAKKLFRFDRPRSPHKASLDQRSSRPAATLSVSVEIVAGCDDFCRALLFFLSPGRRSGERTEERGGPSSPQPSPPSDGGEREFGCGSPRCVLPVLRQPPARDSRNAAISSPLRTSRTSPTNTGWFQVLPLIAGNRASSLNWSGVAPTSAS